PAAREPVVGRGGHPRGAPAGEGGEQRRGVGVRAVVGDHHAPAAGELAGDGQPTGEREHQPPQPAPRHRGHGGSDPPQPGGRGPGPDAGPVSGAARGGVTGRGSIRTSAPPEPAGPAPVSPRLAPRVSPDSGSSLGTEPPRPPPRG